MPPTLNVVAVDGRLTTLADAGTFFGELILVFSSFDAVAGVICSFLSLIGLLSLIDGLVPMNNFSLSLDLPTVSFLASINI